MRNRQFSVSRLLSLLSIVILGWGIGQILAQTRQAQSPAEAGTDSGARVSRTPNNKQRITSAQRKAAAQRATAAHAVAAAAGVAPNAAALSNPSGTALYFGGYPNYANTSPLLRKFVDTLPGLGPGNKNNLGQYIPIATPISNPDGTDKWAGSDYYEIGLVDYTQQMHSDLPATTQLRGYKDLNPTPNPVYNGDNKPHYLGPLIIARKDRPVRIKFTNSLGLGSAGDLFLPVDTTVMGAGMGPNGNSYSQNRATLHLHGGNTPWISDGTPHQWTVPAGDPAPIKKGVSSQDVPDMPPSGPGSMTFFYTNQQSSRLMFYHDHAYGLTRLNVYAGEAAGYLLTDPIEDGLIASGALPNQGGGVYNYGIPLIIQDKTFVDSTKIAAQDPTWNWGGNGNLWFPHVYMPNQNPNDPMGVSAMGRWDYGPWFWPPVMNLTHPPTGNPSAVPPTPTVPATPNPSLVPESFMDTPVVNGTAYPYLAVAPQAYRFRILNASNDRSLNLQLYVADPAAPTEVKMVPATVHTAATAPPVCPATVTASTTCWPATWPTDGRDGGVPDPATAGPQMVQIGTEGGLLPAPVVLPNTPVGYEYNRRNIVVLNVLNKTLFLGPAERADVIIDFSQFAGSRIILYNDAPAPVPAFDERYEYYTGAPDHTFEGGAPTPLAGHGPNIRTMMQFQVAAGTPAPFNLAALQSALPGAFTATQPAAIVPANTYSRIQDTSLNFNGLVHPMQPKTIQELFELDYGRMNATLGVELPFTSMMTQTTLPLGYIDPPTEIINDGETQLWKITHNGVDTHAIHFHLFNVQLVNRVGWDGQIRPPDPNELGWKETVRMHPLEDAIVALKPISPKVPFPVPDSNRLLDVMAPIGSTAGFSGYDPVTGKPMTVTNAMTNFGWEYVWHCHLLGHEENDMMRPIVFKVAAGTATATGVAPALGLPGTNVSVTFTGTNLTGAMSINPGAGITVTGLTPVSPTQVRATLQIAPYAAPGNRSIFVITPQGVTNGAAFNVLAPLWTITGITPPSGAAGSSVAVSLTGTNMAGATSINAGPGITAQKLVASQTQITATFAIAANAAQGARYITAGYPIGTSTGMVFTVLPPAPVLTTIGPASGLVGTNVPVTIAGANLTGATLNLPAGITTSAAPVVTATQVTATFAIAATATAGAQNVTVTTTGGPSNALTFTVIPLPPAVTSIAPASGAASTSVPVTITGTNLTGATLSLPGGVTTTTAPVITATQITATLVIALNATTGARNLTLTTAGGTSGPLVFTVLPPPPSTLTSIAPASGAAGTSVPVTITGTNLTGATLNLPAGITTSAAPVVIATQITATFVIAANAATGARSITATTASGTSGAITFTVNPPTAPTVPTLTSITPTSGAAGTNVPVTITGTNLTGATLNLPAGITASAAPVVTATQITATFVIAANAATGARSITATTTSGTSGAVTFTVNAPTPPTVPTLTSITPNSGAAGTSVPVTITGTNLTGATLNLPAGITATTAPVVTATQITATFAIAANATQGNQSITATAPGGTSNAVTFSLQPTVTGAAPAITSVSPNSIVRTNPGTITVTGTNFSGATASGIQILFNGLVQNVFKSASSISATQITFRPFFVTGATAGTGWTITVTTASGTSNAMPFTLN